VEEDSMALRIALFGQAAFGREVLLRLLADGHAIAAVYTPPDTGRPDPLAEAARERGLALLQHRHFRRKESGVQAGEAGAQRAEGEQRRAPARFAPIARILDEYRALRVDLNVLAYVTAILPPEIVDHPPRRSLCFHPSLLPRFRGGSALAWQIIEGERESGVTVFQPDAGVDTGPIVVQKGGVAIEPSDTAATLYFDKLYPLGVEALAEAVAAVAAGTADYRPQDESRASFQGLVGDAEARLDFSQPAEALDRRIRGCDPQPGAWALRAGERVRLFGGGLLQGAATAPPGTVLGIEAGRLVVAARGGRLGIGKVRVGQGAKLAAAESGIARGERLT
jgi:methionyl-tRNA formyltransferase